MSAKTIIGLALVVLVALFTLQNTEVVALRFLWWEFAMSRVLMFLLLFGLGLLLGLLLGTVHRKRGQEPPVPPASPPAA